MARQAHTKAPVGEAGRNAGGHRGRAEFGFNIDEAMAAGRPKTFDQLTDWQARFAMVANCSRVEVDSVAHLIPRAAARMFPNRQLMTLTRDELQKLNDEDDKYLN